MRHCLVCVSMKMNSFELIQAQFSQFQLSEERMTDEGGKKTISAKGFRIIFNRITKRKK